MAIITTTDRTNNISTMGIMEDVSPMGIAGVIVMVVAFLCELVGFAAPYWYLFELGQSKTYFGLWRFCVKELSAKACTATSDSIDFGWFKATQALSCLGFIALLVAVVFAVLGVFILKDKKMFRMIGAGAAIAGGVFIFLAVVIFGAKVNDLDPSGTIKFTDDLHASFGLCVIAFISAIVAGVLLLVGGMKE